MHSPDSECLWDAQQSRTNCQLTMEAALVVKGVGGQTLSLNSSSAIMCVFLWKKCLPNYAGLRIIMVLRDKKGKQLAKKFTFRYIKKKKK